VPVAGVKAMRDSTGLAWRVARSGVGEDKRGRWREPEAWAFQSGAAMEPGDGTSVKAPSCAPSAPRTADPSSAPWRARARPMRTMAMHYNGAAPRAGELRLKQCVQMQARGAAPL